MINPDTLETLLLLHNENQEKAEKILAQLMQKKSLAQSTLLDLVAAKEKYQQNFHELTKKGMTSFNYNQYILFINNMEDNLLKYYKDIEFIEKEIEIAKSKWIETKKQVLIYSNIKEKQNIILNNTMLKKEQRQQDEWCLRQFYEKNKEK